MTKVYSRYSELKLLEEGGLRLQDECWAIKYYQSEMILK